MSRPALIRSSLCLWALTVHAGPAPARTPPSVVYADNASPTTISAAPWEDTLGSADAIATLADGARYVSLAHHAAAGSALLTIDADASLRLHTLDADPETWSPGETLASSVGSLSSELAAMAFEADTGDLLIVYRSASQSTLSYRTRSDGVLSAEGTLNLGLAAAPDQLLLAACPSTDRIMLLARAGATLVASEWTASSFGPAATLTSSAQTSGRAFDAAYEATSAHALAVSTSSGIVSAHHWDGSGWTSAGSMNADASTPTVVRAAPAPATTDQIIVLVARADGSLKARAWTGTAWGTAQTLESSAADTGAEQRADVAWNADASAAVVAWARPNSGLVRRRTWSGTGWSSESTGPTFTTAVRRLRMVTAERGAAILAAAHLQASSLSSSDYIVYAESTLSQGSATIGGLSGANVPGVDLPAAPSSSHGSTNLSYGNNQTISLPPGSYEDCSFGQGCTINLSAGTYRFKTFDIGGKNTITLNADTTAGDVELIITSGDLNPRNNFTAANAGAGTFTIHILNGDLDAKNNAVLTNVHFIAYNGNIELENNLSAAATLWAQGSVALSSGHVSAPSTMLGSPGPLALLFFTDTSPDAPVIVTSALHASPLFRAFDLRVPPAASGLSILRWTQADPNADK